MFKTLVAILLVAFSAVSFGTERLSVQQAGSYLVKRSNGTVVNTPGYVGPTQYFTQYNDAVSLAATASRACGGCDIWVVQPSLKINMVSDAPSVTTITATVTNKVLALSWVAPTTRTNGVALAPSEIASFVVTIMQGTTLFKTITTNGTTFATTATLTAGSYTMSVVCVDTNGLVSVPSDVFAVTVN